MAEMFEAGRFAAEGIGTEEIGTEIAADVPHVPAWRIDAIAVVE